MWFELSLFRHQLSVSAACDDSQEACQQTWNIRDKRRCWSQVTCTLLLLRMMMMLTVATEMMFTDDGCCVCVFLHIWFMDSFKEKRIVCQRPHNWWANRLTNSSDKHIRFIYYEVTDLETLRDPWLKMVWAGCWCCSDSKRSRLINGTRLGHVVDVLQASIISRIELQ